MSGHTPFRDLKHRGAVVTGRDYPLVYRWGNNAKRATLKGRRCRQLAQGRKGTILIEFENGERVTTSYRAVRSS